MSSARSTTSSSAPATRPYKSKVGILPSSLPAYHKDFIERAKAEDDDSAPSAAALAEPAGARPETLQEEAARRLKPHSRGSQLRLDEMGRRPNQAPANPPKKTKPVRWQFGIRSRNTPWEALLCIHKALHKLGATYLPDEDYEKRGAGAGGDESAAEEDAFAPLRRFRESASTQEALRRYKLPADPWRIKVRWETSELGKPKIPLPDTAPDESSSSPFVAMHLDIQIYEMEQGVYLVDFKCSGYETHDRRLLEDKEVMGPFPFLDMAARLIMQLAEAD